MKSKIKLIFAIHAAFILFAVVAANAQHDHAQHQPPSAVVQNDQALIKELKGKDGLQAMVLANEWRQRNVDVVTFVKPEAVHFKFKNGTEKIIPLPPDKMIVSIAPYINFTHPCSVHHMSKCDAELKNTPVKVTAVTANGKILIDKTIKTLPTGFLDLTLPRDKNITLSVSALGKKASGEITTYRDSKTCDTTLKLE